MTQSLTSKQAKLLLFINNRKNWRPPTYDTMCEYMQVKSHQSIADYLRAIKKKGYKLPLIVRQK